MKIFWIITHLISLIVIFIFSWWIWGYIRFRPEIQMFFLTAASVFIIFISVTVAFTFLLFKRDFFAGYEQSLLGIGWTVITPLISVGTFIILNLSGVFSAGEMEKSF